MVGWILFAARWLWAWLAPTCGPLVLWAAQRIGLPGWSAIRGALIVSAVAGVLGMVGWHWLTKPQVWREPVVTVSQVEANRLKAQLDAERKARAAAEANASFFEELAAQHAREIAAMAENNKRLRDATPNSAAPVLPADDPWLRSKSKAGGP